MIALCTQHSLNYILVRYATIASPPTPISDTPTYAHYLFLPPLCVPRSSGVIIARTRTHSHFRQESGEVPCSISPPHFLWANKKAKLLSHHRRSSPFLITPPFFVLLQVLVLAVSSLCLCVFMSSYERSHDDSQRIVAA